MPNLPRPRFLVGLALGFLLAAGLVALLGPSLPALAQAGRVAAATPPLEPFRAEGLLSAPDEITIALEPPVPAGKLLVVEAVFGNLVVPTGTRAILLVGPPGGEVLMPLVLAGAISGGADLYVASPTTTRLYVSAGPVNLRVELISTLEATSAFTVVGHLVPAP